MAKKQKRSERYIIDANGEEVDRMELGTGAGYQLVKADGSEVQSWEEQLGPAGTLSTMHAILGFWTKLGNEANTVLNDKSDPGTLADAAAAITAHIENCNKGVWREVGESVPRGPKYDKDILAGALVAFLTRSQIQLNGDLAHYRTKLDDKSYAARVRTNPDVMAQYFADLAAKGIAAPKSDSASLA